MASKFYPLIELLHKAERNGLIEAYNVLSRAISISDVLAFGFDDTPGSVEVTPRGEVCMAFTWGAVLIDINGTLARVRGESPLLRPDEVADYVKQYRARFSTFDAFMGADISKWDRLGAFAVEVFTGEAMPPVGDYPPPSTTTQTAALVVAV
jgi:hypothetical protein